MDLPVTAGFFMLKNEQKCYWGVNWGLKWGLKSWFLTVRNYPHTWLNTVKF